MVKKIIAVVLLILTALGIYYYYEPLSIDAVFSLSGSIRSAEGDILAPCTVNFEGSKLYYLFGNKANLLKGAIQLIDEEAAIHSYVVLERVTVSTPKGSPIKKLEHAFGYRYRGTALGGVTCNLYYTEDYSFCVLVDHTTIYCLSSLSESETNDMFNQIAQLANLAA